MSTVRFTLGHDLHARPVAAFSSAATASGARVTLGRPGAPAVPADNMLLLMSADLRAGDEVELTVEHAPAVLVALQAMLNASEQLGE